MKQKRINLWPLLPFAGIALSILVAQFVPNAQAERSPSESAEQIER